MPLPYSSERGRNMAKVSAFGFTNSTAGSNTLTPLALGLTSNYAVKADTATEAVLNNKTAPIDVEEIISFRSRNISSVNNSLNIQYPSRVKKGVQYQVQIEDTLSTTDTVDPDFRLDEPIVMYLTVRHPKSGNIGNAQVGQVFLRLISSLMKTDGTWRFDDLMRSAERPVVD
jgi:hypothetical protein